MIPQIGVGLAAPLPPRRESFFLVRLESLRGVACLMVAAGHSFMVVQSHGWEYDLTDWLLVLFNGPAAVILFFVLSGFVLGLALDRSQGASFKNYGAFVFRRFGRVYPAYFISSLVILVYLWFFPHYHRVPQGTAWLNAFYREPLPWRSSLANLLFIRSDVNNVTWTLQIELIGSLLLPFLHWGTRAWSPIAKSLLLFGLIGLAFVDVVPAPLGYVYMFYLGAVLPSVGPAIFEVLNRARWLKYLFVVSALVLFLGAIKLHGSDRSSVMLHQALAAAFLICAILSSGDERLWGHLENAVLRFFGRISYSLYLFHFIVLYWLAKVLFRWVPEAGNTSTLAWGIGFFGASLVVATLLAWAAYFFIEQPGTDWSKRMSRRVLFGMDEA